MKALLNCICVTVTYFWNCLYQYVKFKFYKEPAKKTYWVYSYYIGNPKSVKASRFIASKKFDSIQDGDIFTVRYLKEYYRTNKVNMFVTKKQVVE